MNNVHVSDAMKAISIRVHTPDGTMFVHIAEDAKTGKPVEILINIGKSGYSLAAWAEALQRVTALALKAGVDIHDIINEISNLRTGKVTMSNGVAVRSGPEGLVVALMRYLALKNRMEEDGDYRPARLER